jgi:hypothetical protein
VAPEDVAVCEERYNKSKLVHSIMCHVAETTGSDLDVRLRAPRACMRARTRRMRSALLPSAPAFRLPR